MLPCDLSGGGPADAEVELAVLNSGVTLSASDSSWPGVFAVVEVATGVLSADDAAALNFRRRRLSGFDASALSSPSSSLPGAATMEFTTNKI